MDAGIFTQSGGRVPMDLRRVNIDGADTIYSGSTPTSGLLLYASSDHRCPRRIACQDVYAKPNTVGKSRSQHISHDSSYAGPNFGEAITGDPPDGDFVPDSVAGMDYESPGYRWDWRRRAATLVSAMKFVSASRP